MSKYENYTKEQLIAKITQLESKKSYGLVWDDEKEPENVVLECKNNIPILKKIEDKTIHTDNNKPNNILIEGDNYHALQVLNYTHKGQIDVIYIDPPYNTGNKDFKYNDSFVDKEDGYRHSKWLNFMSKRLKLAHNLLKDSGIILISIDDNEMAQLKILCDEIFFEENYRNTIALRRYDKNLNTQFLEKGLKSFNQGVEYVLLYSKKATSFINPIFRDASVKRSTRGYWKGFWNDADRPTMRYDILGFEPQDGQWKWEQTRACIAVNNYEKYILEFSDQISLENYWISTGKNKEFIKRNPKGKGKNKGVEHWIAPSSGILRSSNWIDIIATEGENDYNFSSPKNINLLFELLSITKSKSPIILDFFAGSGTTGHAVFALNQEDGGNRQFILCTNNENDICTDVTYPRLSKVINGYTTPKGVAVGGLGGNIDYYRTDLVPTDGIVNISDTTREELTKKAGNMIAIKENTHAMIELNEHYQIFKNETSSKQTAIYFTEDLSHFDELIQKVSPHKIKLYIFSFGKIDKSSFKYLGKNFEIEDIPEPIIEIYKEINKEGIL